MLPEKGGYKECAKPRTRHPRQHLGNANRPIEHGHVHP